MGPAATYEVSIGAASVRHVYDDTDASRKALVMNTNYGYQLYQAERIMNRAEVLSADAQRGRRVAAVTRGGRRLARNSRASAAMAVNAIIAVAVRTPARAGQARPGEAARRVAPASPPGR
jgi:hypothetical protein